ncbi:hypothetical protein MtrunA17_Chr1g0152111 [Medicago truncatula]|uniref:Transmembrane protein n=1 Tax=Medicago truncatula TaxID=3880 RepID=A0A396JJ48_MEDTR|nr:hypothetical protein MtrunA17_Chr1g0152111 [Medicago truncatula]
MEMMELCYHICYTLCFEFCLPPFMDWMESFVTMNMTAEFIFYACLTLFIHLYFHRFIHWINPFINITTKGMLTPIVITIILFHRFDWSFASTPMDFKMALFSHICYGILFNLSIPRIIHWINPSSNVTNEFLLIPILSAIIEFHSWMPLSELEPSQGS